MLRTGGGATVNRSDGDEYTTAVVEPLTSVDIGALALKAPGTRTVATLSGNPPTACINSSRRFTGFDIASRHCISSQ
jgi:polar amino acid transport system permease protein/polar amino acid transport system substrate-binding protein